MTLRPGLLAFFLDIFLSGALTVFQVSPDEIADLAGIAHILLLPRLQVLDTPAEHLLSRNVGWLHPETHEERAGLVRTQLLRFGLCSLLPRTAAFVVSHCYVLLIDSL
jgi:hypothetical protein